MVLKIEPEEETFYEEGMKALLVDKSCLVRELDALEGAEIYECGVNQEPSAIAYWIKYNNSCIGYFIVKPFGMPDGKGYSAIRGWVQKVHRDKGLYPQLLITACSRGSLISDRDGSTPKAYNAWQKVRGVTRRYFDQQAMDFAEEDTIPEEEKFSSNPEGKRWLLVLDLAASTYLDNQVRT